mmetsp:Transcript_5525/g.9542  ORF Transcript_5525/g.9542 Transcript_5525/m.9542 type:complete len:234 (-) Transcript_5525:153-854(-)|eukprot:CAMPEP_0198213296 /NCGR_PEP_ID=MMETSP1445-20131203/28787_1 /TAXON_ID=36898 /ORGANISM="Pyramimonas sp., Strain CCMP2087" /LENGTH=233 /DNA_ID=CAMNT_0043887921 /DNA_START=331 /DNA_END=1032 /DNA_ORIENTATION=-
MSSEDIILKFLQDQNRPFNTQNVTDFMQKHGIKKPTVQKVLDDLAEKGRLVVKEYNKTKIYHASQADLEVPSPEELQAGAQRLQELQQEIDAEKQAVAVLDKEVSVLMRSLTDEQVTERIQKSQAECEEMEGKLQSMRGTTNVISKEDLQKTEKQFAAKFSEYRKRKRMFKSVWETLLESSEKKASALEEEIGIENDASQGVDADALQAVFDKVSRQGAGRSSFGRNVAQKRA